MQTCDGTPPAGYAGEWTDCDDSLRAVYPGSPEVCDGARNDCFAHRCAKEPPLAQRAKNAGYGYRGVAENIAGGSPTPAEVVEGWMNSPGHRANILRREYTHVAIGVAVGPGWHPSLKATRWVQVFTRRRP